MGSHGQCNLHALSSSGLRAYDLEWFTVSRNFDSTRKLIVPHRIVQRFDWMGPERCDAALPKHGRSGLLVIRIPLRVETGVPRRTG